MLWIARTVILLSHSFLCCKCPSHVLGIEEQQGLEHKLPMKYQANNRLQWHSWSSHSKFALARCETTPKQRSLGDFKQIVLIDSNATKMKPFHCITRAREIPLHVKLVLLQSFLWTAVIAPTLSFLLPQRGRWKAAFPQHYFPDLRTCMGASFVWLGAGSKLMGWEEMRSTLS